MFILKKEKNERPRPKQNGTSLTYRPKTETRNTRTEDRGRPRTIYMEWVPGYDFWTVGKGGPVLRKRQKIIRKCSYTRKSEGHSGILIAF